MAPSLSVPNALNPTAGYEPVIDSHSRSSSINSHSPSVQSNAASTRYMLQGMNNNSSGGLDPPNLPYGSRAASFRSMSPKNDTPLMDSKGVPSSLSINYIPSKFSGMKRRKVKGGDIPVPKTGGGRDAFRANESRMPGDGDDDYDGVTFGKGGRKRWNRFKWVLFFCNLVVSTVPAPPVNLRPIARDPCPAMHVRPLAPISLECPFLYPICLVCVAHTAAQGASDGAPDVALVTRLRWPP